MELERPVAAIVGTPVDTTTCDRVCAAVVSTRTVSGDGDDTLSGCPQALAGVMHFSCRCEGPFVVSAPSCSFEAVVHKR